MAEEIVQAEINRIKNLHQYKNKTQEELEVIASANLKKKNADIGSKFTNADEAKQARELLQRYIAEYPNLSYGQMETIEDLIVHQINKSYIQKQIDTIKSEKKSVPLSLFEQLQTIEEYIYGVKEKIGLNDKTEVGELSGLQMLQKKFEKYINENRNEFTCVCSNCGTMLLLRKVVKDFDVLNHPWFAGRWLFNLPIIKFVKEGILTKEQATEILNGASKGKDSKPAFSKEYCSDYIDYCLKNYGEIIENLTQEKE